MSPVKNIMPAKVLVHICCGPCAVYPVKVLRERGHEVMGLFFNPNIHPLKEYLHRLDSARRAAQVLGVRIIGSDRDYDPQMFLRLTAFREEHRCFLCHQLRLERTRTMARQAGFDFFTTTLLYSRRQKHDMIRSVGESLTGKKTAFLYHDFRQGWVQGREEAAEMGLYRQSYCGCIYSEFERFRGELDRL